MSQKIKLVIATNNKHKVEEIKALVPEGIELMTLCEINCHADIPETGSTLHQNASLKSAYVLSNYQMDCFADDTGLEVEALHGAPGVYSARYAGENVTFEQNVEKLLHEMKGKTNRKARFRTVISLRLNGKEHYFEGIVNGHITPARSADEGFGYDPVFMPEGFDRTFAQMSLDEKNSISHRGRAVAALVDFLKKQL